MISISDIGQVWMNGRRSHSLEMANEYLSYANEDELYDVAECMENCASVLPYTVESEEAMILAATVRNKIWENDKMQSIYANIPLIKWYRQRADFDKAISELDKSLHMAEELVDETKIPYRNILIHLAETYRDSGNKDKAIQLLETCSKIEPISKQDLDDYRYIMGELAALYEEKNQYDSAAKAMDQRIYKYTSDPISLGLDGIIDLERAGDLNYRGNDIEHARQLWSKGLELLDRQYPMEASMIRRIGEKIRANSN